MAPPLVLRQALGFWVDTVYDGEAAMEALKQKRYALVRPPSPAPTRCNLLAPPVAQHSRSL